MTTPAVAAAALYAIGDRGVFHTNDLMTIACGYESDAPCEIIDVYPPVTFHKLQFDTRYAIRFADGSELLIVEREFTPDPEPMPEAMAEAAD